MRLIASPRQERLRLNGELVEFPRTNTVALHEFPAILVSEEEGLLRRAVSAISAVELPPRILLLVRIAFESRVVPFKLMVDAPDPEFKSRDLFPHEADDFSRRVVDYFDDIVGREDLVIALALGSRDTRSFVNAAYVQRCWHVDGWLHLWESHHRRGSTAIEGRRGDLVSTYVA